MHYLINYLDEYGTLCEDIVFAYSEKGARSIFSEAFPNAVIVSVKEEY